MKVEVKYALDQENDICRRITTEYDTLYHFFCKTDLRWFEYELDGAEPVLRQPVKWTDAPAFPLKDAKEYTLKLKTLDHAIIFGDQGIKVGCQYIDRSDCLKLFKRMGDWLGYDVD